MTARRDRAIAVAAVLAVVAVIALVVATVVQGQRNGRDALEEQQQAQIDQLAASMDARIAATLQSIGATISPRPWNLSPGDPADHALAEQLNGASKAGSFLVDRTGTIVNGVLLDNAKVGDRYGNGELAATMADGKPALLSTAPGLTTPDMVIPIAVPITRPGAGVVGALVLESPVSADSDFNKEVRELGRGNTGEFSFADAKDVVVASSDATLLGHKLPAKAVLKGTSAGFHRADHQVAAIANVPSARWRAVFVQDASEFDGGLTGPLRSALLLLAVAAVLASGIVFVMLARRLRTAREEQRRLARISESQEQFITIVSHELRTPVAGLLGFLRTTLERWDVTPDEDRRQAVDRAYANARRLQRLATEVLATSRVESGDVEYSLRPMDLRSEVVDAVAAARRTHGGRVIDVTMPEGGARIDGDAERVQQVLANLLDNALSNSPAETTVEVGVSRDHDEVVVSVTDHGPGIPEEELDRVFDKFVRGRGPVSRGTGLGLYICRRIVEGHGGRITASSLPGMGTTITIAFPLAADDLLEPAGDAEEVEA